MVGFAIYNDNLEDETIYISDLVVEHSKYYFWRSYCGVDLMFYDDKEAEHDGKTWELWMRVTIGLTSSPYEAVQGMGFVEEVIKGDSKKILLAKKS